MNLVPVHMPKYGMTMEAGIVAQWLVEEGDHVEEGDSIAVITTEKVDTELGAPTSGTIAELSVDVEAEVPVGNIIAYIDKG